MNLRKNMGTIDRAIRAIIAIVILGLYITKTISGTAAIVLLVVAIAFLATSAVGSCPMYLPFGLSTRKKKD